MKSIEKLTKDDRELLTAVLESATPKSVTTVKELRIIDKLCDALSGDLTEIEDSDYEFLKRRIAEFSGWVPKGRKDILRVANILEI